MNNERLWELCGVICETMSLVEDVMAEEHNMGEELQYLKYLHSVIFDCHRVNDVEEWQLVSIMILGEKVRNIDAALPNILNSECLDLIKYIRIERGSSK